MINKQYIRCLALAFFIITITTCKKHENNPDNNPDNYLDKPNCSASFIPKTHSYQVVGFYPSWERDAMPLQSVQWEKLTRIVYCFAIPNADGTINTGDLVYTRQLVDSAHAHGVEAYFSIGGGDGSASFPVMAANEKSRSLFIKEVRQFLFETCLDGVDIDWEYWSGYNNNVVVPAESNALVSLLKDLRGVLAPFNLGISIDLGASDWSGKHFFDEIPDWVDDLQVMCYDFTGPWSAPGPHSAFDDAIGTGNGINSTGLAYWVNYRGWPKEKILLGVPFYGKDFDIQGGMGISYSQIIDLFPDAYLVDRVNNIYYDGIITMARKTQYVVDNKYSGIMIWEIIQDTHIDSTSLLNAIDKVLHP